VKVEVRPSPDDDAYVTRGVPSNIYRITAICESFGPMESYEDVRRATVDLLERAIARGGGASNLTLLWPARWTGLTPLGVENRGPTWEDAEWLG
jgi:hypothetical protein